MFDENIGRLGFGIDRGGTFTDVFVVYPNGNCRTFKLLSEDSNYNDAPTEAIRRILSEYTRKEILKGQLIDVKHIAWIRMGTTVATNALLERKGEPMALLITKGFKVILTCFLFILIIIRIYYILEINQGLVFLNLT